MPRKIVTRVYVAEGFYHDCEELIEKCLKADIVTYHVFCNIWKDMNFAQVFWGRQLGSELAELSEEVIHVAKSYFVGNTNNIEESISGLFLVYGLLNLQPYPGFAALRIIPDDIVHLKRIEMVARSANRYDVLYILGSLLINGPVEYQAQIRDYGFEIPLKKYFQGYIGNDMPGQRISGVLSHHNEELNILREINSLTNKYSGAKNVLTKAGIWSEKLNYSNNNLAKDLDASFKKVLTGTAFSEHILEMDKEVAVLDEYNHLQSVKMKAMAVNKNIAKHRVGVHERKKESEKKASEKNALNNSPKKPSPTKPKRRFTNKSIRTNKRYRVHMSSDSSDSETAPTVSPSSLNQTSKTEKQNQELEAAEKEINIQIEALPVFISVDCNKEYEIEIIDNMQSETTNDAKKTIEKDSKTNKRKADGANNNDDEPITKIKKVATTKTKEKELPILNVSPLESLITEKAKGTDNKAVQTSTLTQTQAKDKHKHENIPKLIPISSPKTQKAKDKDKQDIQSSNLITIDSPKTQTGKDSKAKKSMEKNPKKNKSKNKHDVRKDIDEHLNTLKREKEFPILNVSPGKSPRSETAKSKDNREVLIPNLTPIKSPKDPISNMSPRKSSRTETTKGIDNQKVPIFNISPKTSSKTQTTKVLSLSKLPKTLGKVLQKKVPIPNKPPKHSSRSLIYIQDEIQTPKVVKKQANPYAEVVGKLGTQIAKVEEKQYTPKPKNKGRKISPKKCKMQNEDIINQPIRNTRSSMRRLSSTSGKTET